MWNANPLGSGWRMGNALPLPVDEETRYSLIT